MKQIIFVTGNDRKVGEAKQSCDLFDIQVLQRTADIDEIQSHEPLKVSEHKARTAYDQINEPLVVTDTFWSIPALNGFPGAYMKEAFELLKMSDYARIDIRIDAAGRYYFIDPNANPFFGPPKETHATYSMILDMYGVTFEETLKRLFLNTLQDARIEQNGWH